MNLRRIVTLNLNGDQDSQSVRGYTTIKNTAANHVKAVTSCVYNSMIMMAMGEGNEDAVLSNSASVRRL